MSVPWEGRNNQQLDSLAGSGSYTQWSVPCQGINSRELVSLRLMHIQRTSTNA